MKKFKKIILITTLVCSNYCFSQDFKFGVSAGYLGAYARVTENGGSASTSDSGFYLGAFSKIGLNEKLFLNPEINYGAINGNGFGFIALKGGYYFLDKLNLQIGPQISYILETTTDEVSKVGIDLSGGFGYDITPKVNLQARYAFEITNRARDANVNSDVKARFDWLFVGLGYTF